MSIRYLIVVATLAVLAPSCLAQKNAVAPMNPQIVSVDAKWSDFGAYLFRWHQRIADRWSKLIRERKVATQPGCVVTVKFAFDADGKIEEIVETSGSAARPMVDVCVEAVAGGAPYDKWTKPMRDSLGDRQVMVLSFRYE